MVILSCNGTGVSSVLVGSCLDTGGCSFLDVFIDIFSNTADSSQLSLIIALTLQDFLQKSLESLHSYDLEVAITC